MLGLLLRTLRLPLRPLLAGLLLLCAPLAYGATIAVLYPEVTGPYVRVFENIISGVEDAHGVRVVSRTLEDDTSASDAEAWVRAEGAETVIALGQRGYKVAKEFSADIPVVVGAALVSPDGLSGISLAADPEQFFERLGALTPPVKRVFVVYSEQNNGWLVRRAQHLASGFGIRLIAYEADTMRGAVKNYLEMLDEARDPQDAIWLPLDNVAPDKTILPLVLEAAWKKRLVVFSNNPSHAKKGALFSLFPDHRGMGQRLAEMALALTHEGGSSRPGIVPLRDLKVAVNLRTAAHLGMLYTPNQQRNFALVFPSR